MAQVPRWRGLKHQNHVTTVEYADGQTFFDILKVSNPLFSFLNSTDIFGQCILPCIAQTIKKGSPLVECIRAYSRYRMMVDIHCHSERRLGRLREYKVQYMDAAQVSFVLSLTLPSHICALTCCTHSTGGNKAVWQELRFPEATCI